MRTMTVAEAVEWADDVIDRVDSAEWYGQVYSTCDAVMDDAQSNQGLNAETVIRTQSGEDAACVGEDELKRISNEAHSSAWYCAHASLTGYPYDPGAFLSQRYEDLMDKD